MRTLALILALTACADTPAARYDACTDYLDALNECAWWAVESMRRDDWCADRADTHTLREWRCWTEHECAPHPLLSPQVMCSDED